MGGKRSNAIRLGNLLNKTDVEKTAVKSNDVRKELYELMAEREQEGLDPKPTDDILDEFAETYPHVSRQSLGQWISILPLVEEQNPCVLTPLVNLQINALILKT